MTTRERIQRLERLRIKFQRGAEEIYRIDPRARREAVKSKRDMDEMTFLLDASDCRLLAQTLEEYLSQVEEHIRMQQDLRTITAGSRQGGGSG